MKCAILSDTGPWVRAGSGRTERRLQELKDSGEAVTLVVTDPVHPDVVRRAGYSAKNTLHVFVRAADDPWAAPLLASADRCGMRLAVTLYPIIPGAVQCVDVLEKLSPLSANYSTRFLFMFPRISLPAEKTERGYRIGRTEVDAEMIQSDGTRLYPSAEYIRRFMDKAHSYLDCTAHVCGVCGRDCHLCLGGSSGR